MPISGHCLCGAVTYESQADPVMQIICHCDDCQRGSGAGFSVNAVVPTDALNVTGELKTFETTSTDTGQPRQRQFCPNCGSNMFTRMAEMPLTVVKAGTLDDKSIVAPAMEIWTESAQPWRAEVEGRKTFPRDLQM